MRTSMLVEVTLLVLFGIMELSAINHDDLPVSAKSKVIVLETTEKHVHKELLLQ